MDTDRVAATGSGSETLTGTPGMGGLHPESLAARSAATKPERRFELLFLGSANFKPGEELREVVASRDKTRMIDKRLAEGWGLSSVGRVVEVVS